jgi:exportin-7
MVHIIAAVISGRLSVPASEEADVIDGALACRVFHLMRFSDSRLPTLQIAPADDVCSSFEAKLETAFISFQQQFRRMYIGDTAISSSKAFTKMGELLGLGTHVAVLNVMVAKITTNIKYWKANTAVIDKTLALFFDLATGFCSGKLVARLDIVTQIITRHTDEAFSFPPSRHGGKQTMLLYNVLGRLLFSEEHSGRFEEFMKPLEGAFEFLLA